MYLEYGEYKNMGGELENNEFYKHIFEAERVIDKFTTGIDNVHKLQIAFPTNEYDVNAVKHCIAKLVDTIKTISDGNSVSDGQGGMVASVSSGAESKSFFTGSAIYSAIGSENAKNNYLFGIVKDCLSGVTDCNGVNLLYGGAYVH